MEILFWCNAFSPCKIQKFNTVRCVLSVTDADGHKKNVTSVYVFLLQYPPYSHHTHTTTLKAQVKCLVYLQTKQPKHQKNTGKYSYQEIIFVTTN